MARSASFLRGRTHRPYRTASFMIVFSTKGRLPRSSFLTYTPFGIHQWYVKFGLPITAAHSLRLSVIRKAVKIESKLPPLPLQLRQLLADRVQRALTGDCLRHQIVIAILPCRLHATGQRQRRDRIRVASCVGHAQFPFGKSSRTPLADRREAVPLLCPRNGGGLRTRVEWPVDNWSME